MSFSTMMVHLDLDQPSESLLRLTADLIQRFDAHLIGITAGDVQPLYFMDGIAAQEMLEKDRAGLVSDMAAKEREFRAAFKRSAGKIEWRSGIGWPAEYVAGEARAADLLIVASSGKGAGGLRQMNAGELVLRAGRPVLIVPPAMGWLKFGSMVVAWKETREARRAVIDALPLLHKAKEVVVVELVERNSDRSAAKARVDDVSAWLVRRGINAATIATKALIAVPDQLAIIAQDEGAEIIVSGAYGHTRFQEWVFGGVTRDLLRQQKCCVFLSH
jgi:nucleotide-binding universal stress UspA family protein